MIEVYKARVTGRASSKKEELVKIHPREEFVDKAENRLRSAICEIQREFDLTDNEFLRVLCVALDSIRSHAKYGIRLERHGDINCPGGLK